MAPGLLLPERLEGKLLAANTRLEHEATLTGREDRYTVLVFGIRRRILRSRHRACLSREGKRPVLEVRERRRSLEKDYFRVGLTTELSANRDLGERHLADGPALLENDARACRTSNADRRLANGRKDGVPDRLVEKAREARIGLLEDGDRFL